VRPSRETAYRHAPVGDSGMVGVRAWKGPAANGCATGPGGAVVLGGAEGAEVVR
jgi:hypothetical protein